MHAAIGVADPVSRWVLLVGGLCALAATFVQEPGRIVSDTKLPVLMAPLAYMANALHLWDQSMWSGSIKTLDFGYIFPMGLFFGAAHLLHVPGVDLRAFLVGPPSHDRLLGDGAGWPRHFGSALGPAAFLAPWSMWWLPSWSRGPPARPRCSRSFFSRGSSSLSCAGPPEARHAAPPVPRGSPWR